MSVAPERTVLIVARDLFFRAKLEAVARAAGVEPVVRGAAPPAPFQPGAPGEPVVGSAKDVGTVLAVVELSGERSVQRIRDLVSAGVPVIAFGPHVQAEWLRAAREAGAEAVPNSQVEDTLRRRLGNIEHRTSNIKHRTRNGEV